jgi:hypothetical protein
VLGGIPKSASKLLASEVPNISLILPQVRITHEGLALESARLNPDRVNKAHDGDEDHGWSPEGCLKRERRGTCWQSSEEGAFDMPLQAIAELAAVAGHKGCDLALGLAPVRVRHGLNDAAE